MNQRTSTRAFVIYGVLGVTLLSIGIEGCITDQPSSPEEGSDTTVGAVTGNVFYRPPPGSPVPGASYTRMIRLEHNGPANGRLLATFENFQSANVGIYESSDDGRTWASTPVATITESVLPRSAGWELRWQPDIFELPTAVGDLPAGTVMLSANAVRFSPTLQTQLQLYVSRDQGHSWQYRSTFVTGEGDGNMWEPNIQVARDGGLVVYYSDESHRSQGFSQLLGHKVSYDGGKTWGPQVNDAAVPDGNLRPGMAVVKRMPNGKYIMSFELVNGGAGSPAHVKFSDDGLNWGNPADLGPPIRAASGAYLGATPYITWSPAGGPNGMVVASGMFITNGKNGGQMLYANYNNGLGNWEELPAPVQWNSGNDHAGWSQGLLPTADGKGLLQMVSSDIGGGMNELRYGQAPMPDSKGIVSGAVYRLSNIESGLYLDLPNGVHDAGAQLAQWAYNGTRSQQWRFNAMNDGTYVLTSEESGLALDDPSGVSKAGTMLQQWYRNDTVAQRFRFDQQPDGSYRITNVAANLCLDVPGGSHDMGVKIQYWNRNDVTAQHWRLQRY